MVLARMLGCKTGWMRHNPLHAVTDVAVVRRLIVENPWATIVSHAGGEIVASHYPVLLDEATEDLAVVTHVGRPDETLHLFGNTELLLIVAGPMAMSLRAGMPPGRPRCRPGTSAWRIATGSQRCSMRRRTFGC